MDIKLLIKGNYICIYINEILHLSFNYYNLSGLQTWIDHEGSYWIELYFNKGANIELEYNTKDKWNKVISLLHDILI